MSNCILAHGFNDSSSGGRNVDRLAPYAESAGWQVMQFDYGWTGLLLTLIGNQSRARTLAGIMSESDTFVGHSNACAIHHRASWLKDSSGGTLMRSHRAIYINPALDIDAALAPGVERLTVFYARDDIATLAARFLPGVLWGAMGRYGYQGRPDTRVRSVNLNDFLAGRVGHSGAFAPENITGFGAMFTMALGTPDQPMPASF